MAVSAMCLCILLVWAETIIIVLTPLLPFHLLLNTLPPLLVTCLSWGGGGGGVLLSMISPSPPTPPI